MNVSEFLFNAKAGILDLSRERPISNKGTISDIRARTEKQLRPAGFPKYSQLGSQNAISAEPKDKIEVDVNVKPEPVKPTPAPAPTPEPAPAPGKPILPGQTKKEEPEPEEKKKLGGDGGQQSDESKAESAVMPSHDPPYYLPQEQGKLDEMVNFINTRYGKKESRKEVDFIIKDSKNFSSAVDKAREIQKAINDWKQKDLGKEWLLNKLKGVSSWFLDKVVDFGTGKIDFTTKDEDKPKDKDGKIDKSKIDRPKEISMGIATEIAKGGINELKKFIQSSYLKPESFEETMKAIQDTLFALKPDWRAKWNALVEVENAKMKKFIRDYFINFDKGNDIPAGKPFAGM